MWVCVCSSLLLEQRSKSKICSTCKNSNGRDTQSNKKFMCRTVARPRDCHDRRQHVHKLHNKCCFPEQTMQMVKTCQRNACQDNYSMRPILTCFAECPLCSSEELWHKFASPADVIHAVCIQDYTSLYVCVCACLKRGGNHVDLKQKTDSNGSPPSCNDVFCSFIGHNICISRV